MNDGNNDGNKDIHINTEITFDDLNLKIAPHFIKIDAEGYDQFVLKGLKKTINRY